MPLTAEQLAELRGRVERNNGSLEAPQVELEIWTIPLDRIQPAPDNPRVDVGDVVELATSIRSLGVLEPLIVTTVAGGLDDGQGYQIVCGHRRYAAAKLAGLDEVPTIVRELDEQGRLEMMLVENLQREGLTPTEEGRAYARLVKFGLKQRELAERVGKSQSHVSKRLALVSLPDAAQEAVVSGGITLEDAQQLAKLPADRIKKAITEVKRWGPGQAHYAIAQATRAFEREQKVAELVAELEKKGESFVKCAGAYQPPNGHAIVDPEAWMANQVRMKVADHKKQPCHVVGVLPEANTIELCNNPSGHPQGRPSTPATRKLTKEEREAKKQREELEQAAGRRRTFVADLLKGKLTKDDVVAIALFPMFVVDGWFHGDACRLVGLELPADLLDVQDGEEPPEDPYAAINDPELLERELYKLAGKSAAERIRVTFAVAAAAIEERLGLYNLWEREVVGYFDLLQAKGYEISTAEQQKLDAATNEGGD